MDGLQFLLLLLPGLLHGLHSAAGLAEGWAQGGEVGQLSIPFHVALPPTWMVVSGHGGLRAPREQRWKLPGL